jgi:hypothetical protein
MEAAPFALAVFKAWSFDVLACELTRYENNYKASNLITTTLGMCMIVSLTLKLLMMFGINYAIFMRAHLKLNLLVRILTIGSTKPLLRNLQSPWMIALLGLSPL